MSGFRAASDLIRGRWIVNYRLDLLSMVIDEAVTSPRSDRMAVTHDTFEIRKICNASPDKVFGAFAFQDRKSRWYAASPAHEPLSYSFDFRPGGEERLVARMLPGTPIAGKELCWISTYAEIVENARIVFFQTLDVDRARVSAAVVTVEIMPNGERSHVLLTHQAVYFEGADGPAIRRMGWEHLLDSMEANARHV
jgi:uncharacterized protein YndB with AHSA1/START domain